MAKRITVKIGTRVIADRDNRLDGGRIKSVSHQIARLMDAGIEVVLVTSGAVAAGLGIMSAVKKGRSLSELQAAASLGQNDLMDIYNMYLKEKGYRAGQMLLTREDFNDRKRFLNIRYTLNTLLRYKAVPVVNENDSISTDEIKFGDNDKISSLVADLSDSDMLILLTDVDGLYDDNGNIVGEVASVGEDVMSLCRGKGCDESSGGMFSKLEAAKNAVTAGITCVIANGKKEGVILDIVNGTATGTRFEAGERTLTARKRWIAFSIKPKGALSVDEGAEKALVERSKSLLPSGIVEITGVFDEGDVIDVVNFSGKTIARGLSNYSSTEVLKIKGFKTGQIEGILGYKDYDEVIHRDNLVIIDE